MYDLPEWIVFILSALTVVAGLEFGFKLGKRSDHKSEHQDSLNALVNVSLSLLAFLLAFTFGAAAERFNDRKLLLIDETNAIDTAYKRADFLPEQSRTKIRELIRNYVDLRLRLKKEVIEKHDPSLVKKALEESNRIQDKLWQETVSVGKEHLDSDVASLFIESINECVDLQRKRVAAAIHARLPFIVWLILFAMTFFSMFSLGYLLGIMDCRNRLLNSMVILCFALVIAMISDLDTPADGFLQTGNAPMQELGKRMGLPDRGD